MRIRYPVYLATLGPKSLEMTGEIADGWLGTSFMPEHADIFFDPMREGRGEGRAATSAPWTCRRAASSPSRTTSSRCTRARKPGVAFTLGAMGSREHNFYNEAYQRSGYKDLALQVQSTWLSGDRAGAAAMIPDEIVVQTNLLGTDETVKQRIRAYRDAGVTTIRVEPEGRGMAGRLETLGRFMRLLDGVSAEKA